MDWDERGAKGKKGGRSCATGDRREWGREGRMGRRKDGRLREQTMNAPGKTKPSGGVGKPTFAADQGPPESPERPAAKSDMGGGDHRPISSRQMFKWCKFGNLES